MMISVSACRTLFAALIVAAPLVTGLVLGGFFSLNVTLLK